MGFWSSVGSFCSSCVSAVSSVASSVYETVSDGISWAKEKVSQAVGYMAEKAEGFVGSIVDVWNTVKPYIKNIRTTLKVIGNHLPYPWMKTAIALLDAGLGHLEKMEESTLAKKLQIAINWTITTARKLKGLILTEEEMEEAKKHKEVFKKASAILPNEGRRAISTAEMLLDYSMVQKEIDSLLASEQFSDFEHYLRLRATQKLLKSAEETFDTAENIDDIKEDDVFMLGVAAQLLAPTPTLNENDAIRLDSIVLNKFGKKLIPFVFEEMIIVWGVNLKVLEIEWAERNKSVSKEIVAHRKLETCKRVSGLSEEEEVLYQKSSTALQKSKQELEEMANSKREMRNYVYAAEGFLQVLEKSAEQLEEEDKLYLAEEGGHVGMIIIDCAQHGKKWVDLTSEEQSLVLDFANIFEDASKARAEQIVEVEV